jgi:hypothetical protein
LSCDQDGYVHSELRLEPNFREVGRARFRFSSNEDPVISIFGDLLYVKLLPLPQPQLRARTDARTNPSAQRATQLRSVLACVYSVSRQNLNTTTVP